LPALARIPPCIQQHISFLGSTGCSWPVFFKPYVQRKTRMLKLFSILQR
jgi:hypothetical protein